MEKKNPEILSLEEETALIRRAGAGDNGALEFMMDKYEPLALRAAHQPHLSTVREDAESEARISLLRALKEFDPSLGIPFAGYAKRRVFGDVRTFFRRERSKWQREVVPFETEDGDSFWENLSGTWEPAAEVDFRETLEKCMEELTEREREVVRCLSFEGMSLTDIARQLGVSPQAVAKRKRKALAKLKKYFEPSMS